MSKIAHLVVLMLENRSFDNLLGTVHPPGPDFDGLSGDEWNPLHGPDGSVQRIRAWNADESDPRAAHMPDPDPGELFADINMQLFGLGNPPEGQPPMSGFVDNYVRQRPPSGQRIDPRSIMHYFTETQLPATHALARAFGVSDRWFGSAPCQTWPNRLFAHTGTAIGRVNNSRIPHPYIHHTIFQQLRRYGHEWRVYLHDFPQTAAFVDLWPSLFKRFRLFEEDFAADAKAGRLPAYSFIEPRYLPGFVHTKMPNDAHPPHNVGYAELLVAKLYNALRASPLWNRSLLVIIADEHGGCYDHVPPPAATPPGPPYKDGFTFDRFGPRVPAILVSPWIPAGTVIRPPTEGPPFDHTTIIATLHRLFGLGPEPTPRAAAAPDLLSALTLDSPDNQGPEQLDVADFEPLREEVRALRHAPRNGHQKTLLHPGVLLPALIARGAGHAHRARRRRRDRKSGRDT